MFTFLKRKRPLSIGIGAIFKDECAYILEWVAWHRSQGIDELIIYDNNSTDGSLQLLSKLASLGVIRFHTINEQQGAQIPAYQAILDDYKHKLDVIAFVDADEFVMPQDEQLAADHLRQLFAHQNVTAVGMNWRIFGSGGQQHSNGDFVLRRFTQAAADNRTRNHYLKSAYRPKAVINIFPHRAGLVPGSQYVNTAGQSLVFAQNNNGLQPVKAPATTGMSYHICNDRLRIHHYAVKSKDEFIKKKVKGDAMWGAGHIKQDGYFTGLDLNDELINISSRHFSRFEQYYQHLCQRLDQLPS